MEPALARFKEWGIPIPQEDEKPDPPGPECRVFELAFQEIGLTKGRWQGGLQPITYPDIVAWGTVNGWIGRKMLASIARVVRAMDLEWMNVHASTQPDAGAKSSPEVHK